MTRKKSTKHTLLMSALSLLMCVSMLIGSTFAWFSDSVTSENNQIESGNLDIELWHCPNNKTQHGSGYDEANGAEIKGDTALFLNVDGDPILWEPGASAGETFRVKNAGELALKFKFHLKTVDAKKTPEGKDLTDVLQLQIIELENDANNTPVKVTGGVDYEGLFGDGYVIEGELLPGEIADFNVAIGWKPTANDNDYNVSGGLKINFAIELFATQLTHEKDSLGDQYDASADYGEKEKEPITYDPAVNGGLYEYLPTLESGTVLVLPGGTYNTSGTLTVAAGVTIKGAEGATVIFNQSSSNQDDIFNCKGDAVFENITFESNRKGYAITDNTKNHDTDGDITVINCKFKGIATEKNWGIYKNLNGNLTVKDCTFDNYNNAICGVNNGEDSVTVITGCTFTNINGEAIGYVTSSMPADFETEVISHNTGLTADNVIGY